MFSYNHTIAWINVNTRILESPSSKLFSYKIKYVNQSEYYWNAKIPIFAIGVMVFVGCSGVAMIAYLKFFKRDPNDIRVETLSDDG